MRHIGPGVINRIAAGGQASAGHRARFFQKGQLLSVSLERLDQGAALLAARLWQAGLRRGEHVGISARNSLEWILLDLAAIKAGLVTAGFEFGRFECDAALAATYSLRAVYAEKPCTVDGVLDLGELVRATAAEVAGDAALETAALAGQPAHYGPRDVTTIKFTSGSTGAPKGLGATVASIDASLAAVQQLFAHGDGDNLLIFLPLSLLQQRYWVYSALVHGHDVTVASYELAFEAARQTTPTVIMGVPGFFDGVKRRVESLAQPDGTLAQRRALIESVLGSGLRYLWTGSAPANPATLDYFNDCGVPLFEGYGMNETCIVSKNYPGAHKRGSVGKLLPNKRARIDAAGVLYIGSDYPVNTRYAYAEPGASEALFMDGGEVRTGDLARIDEDGYLYILGRADDVLVLGNGKNISTRPIEEKIKAHAAVQECVIFGAGKPFLVAVVAPAAEPADHAAIQLHLKQVNAGLQPDQRVGKIHVAERGFSVEGGLLTSQYKPKRKEIYQVYETDINRLYGVHA
ncbi:AMP-binding protein [Oxalobacteraceae bacterium]|nr:AMP-binding protein [Oxalobacteraceae bacterium]